MFSPDFNLSKWPKTLNSKQRYNIEFQWVYYPFPAYISLHNLFLFTRFYWSIALTVIIDPCCFSTTSWHYPVNHVIYSWFIDKNRCGNISSTVSHRKLAYIIGKLLSTYTRSPISMATQPEEARLCNEMGVSRQNWTDSRISQSWPETADSGNTTASWICYLHFNGILSTSWSCVYFRNITAWNHSKISAWIELTDEILAAICAAINCHCRLTVVSTYAIQPVIIHDHSSFDIHMFLRLCRWNSFNFQDSKLTRNPDAELKHHRFSPVKLRKVSLEN